MPTNNGITVCVLLILTVAHTAKKVHDEAVKPATKSVTLNAAWTGVQAGLRLAMSTMRMPAYAKGTDHHPGGPALLGDGGGPELVREVLKIGMCSIV